MRSNLRLRLERLVRESFPACTASGLKPNATEKLETSKEVGSLFFNPFRGFWHFGSLGVLNPRRRVQRALVVGIGLMMIAVLSGPTYAQQDTTNLVNLDHLRFLTEPVTIDGRDMAIVHIYSEFPDYKWVDAAGEGISAVDDVARAAIVYLWDYE